RPRERLTGEAYGLVRRFERRPPPLPALRVLGGGERNIDRDLAALTGAQFESSPAALDMRHLPDDLALGLDESRAISLDEGIESVGDAEHALNERPLFEAR